MIGLHECTARGADNELRREELSQWGTLAPQTGRITGSVTDSSSGQPVHSATVSVVGTKLGASTGSDGRYSISNIPAGTVQLRVQRLGFAPRTRSVVP